MSLSDAIASRLERLRQVSTNAGDIALESEVCASDPIHWINQWTWTYDPREPTTSIPFALWPRQEDFIRWLAAKEAGQQVALVLATGVDGIAGCEIPTHPESAFTAFKSADRYALSIELLLILAVRCCSLFYLSPEVKGSSIAAATKSGAAPAPKR